jgi:hypothetical protein
LADQKSQRSVYGAVLAFLFLFMGWRYEVGCDFRGYLNRFESVSPTADPLLYLEREEAAFQFITALIRTSGWDYVWLNVISTALILSGFVVFLRVFVRPVTMLATMFPIAILQLSMSGIRQGIAAAMLMAAASPFIRGQRIRAALLILLGSQFHTSVLIFLPLAFVAGRTITVARLIRVTVLLTPVALYMMGGQVEEYSNQYIQKIYGEVSSNGAIFRYIFVLVPAVIFLTNWTKFKAMMAEDIARFNLFATFSSVIVVMAPLAVVSSLALHRMTFYVLPFAVVMLVYQSYVYRLYPILGRFHLPIIMSITYFAFWSLLSRHATACYIPYQSYIFQ